MNSVQVFVSFDQEHDRELYDALLAQSQTQNSGFSIVGRSDPSSARESWNETTSKSIGKADQLIVICGVHSDSSDVMTAELRIAQQGGKPYILLWGRRELMCTKPTSAKSSDGMYSWTLPILRDQIDLMTRSAKWKIPITRFKNAPKSQEPTSKTRGK